jgi:hypothetical protein
MLQRDSRSLTNAESHRPDQSPRSGQIVQDMPTQPVGLVKYSPRTLTEALVVHQNVSDDGTRSLVINPNATAPPVATATRPCIPAVGKQYAMHREIREKRGRGRVTVTRIQVNTCHGFEERGRDTGKREAAGTITSQQPGLH